MSRSWCCHGNQGGLYFAECRFKLIHGWADSRLQPVGLSVGFSVGLSVGLSDNI